jgi:hypothetical protein
MAPGPQSPRAPGPRVPELQSPKAPGPWGTRIAFELHKRKCNRDCAYAKFFILKNAGGGEINFTISNIYYRAFIFNPK